ncbi:hypothetical protein D3C72_1342070 [compost metagenome]
MTQQIRALRTKNAGIGKHDRVHFAHALHGVEERDEEDERNRKRNLRPQAKTEPEHEDRGQNDTRNGVHGLDERIKHAGDEGAETQPDAGADAETCSDDIAKHRFAQRDADMLVKTGIGNPVNHLFDDVIGRGKEEAVDGARGDTELPPAQKHDQKNDLDDTNINGLHSFSPLRHAGTPIYRDRAS